MGMLNDTAPAVVVSWDSAADKTYRFSVRPTWETWDWALDGIPGNGTRLMQCFVREEKEVFDRVKVQESPYWNAPTWRRFFRRLTDMSNPKAVPFGYSKKASHH